MKVKLRLLAVVAICALLLVPVTVLAQGPPIPFTVEGYITISGVPAPAGTVVTAKIGGVQVATYTTVPGSPPWGPDWYLCSIPHDASYAGQMVVFYVNDIEGGQVMYGGAGGHADLDLAIGDTEAPTVTGKTPTGSNVPIDTLVTATFSEAMHPDTITTTSFTLAGIAVSGAVSYDPGTYTATFDPTDYLEYSHEYTATLSTDITDAAGNPLESEYSWSFDTVTPAGWGKCGPIDLVIVLDITGSMGSALDTVKAGIPDIVDDAVIASGGDLKMGYITFDGGTAPGAEGAGEQSFGEGAGVTVYEDWVTVVNALTDDISAVMDSIEATTLGWGAGGPEASDEAKNTAVNNLPAGNRADPSGFVGTQYEDFTEPYRGDALKIVVLITDAPPGGFNDVWDTKDTEAMHTHAVSAKDKGILVSDVYIGAGGDVADIFRDDAETSGGAYIQTATGAGVGDAIADIIAACGEGLNAEFSAAPRTGEAPLRVRFTDQSTGCIDSWLWDFGDGDTSTSQNPSHTYLEVGTYDVSLTVTGCGTLGTDTETKIGYITVVAPKAEAGMLPPEPAKIGASYLYISPEQIVPSQWVEISANIYNRGGVKKSHTVALYINGYLAQSQTVGVSPGGTELVVFRVRADSEFLGGIYTGPGEYIANVEGMEGQFFVLAPAAAATTGFFGGPLGTGGIIAIVVVVIVLIVGLVFGLRRE